VLQISPLDFSQYDEGAVLGALERWAGWLSAGVVERFRLVSRAVPLDLSAPIARARQAEARADDETFTQVVRQYRGMLERTVQGELYGNEHYMVVWTGERQAQALGDGLRQLGLLAQARPGLPPLIAGRYRDDWSCLKPADGNPGPFLNILVSYDLLGVWDWRVLASLLYQGYPLAVALDVVTLPRVKAHRSLNMSRNVLTASIADLGQDVELTEKWAALHRAIEAVHYGQTLHLVAVGILIPGRTMEELHERVEAVQTVMGPFMALAVHRPQVNLLRTLFTTASDGPAESLVSGRLRRNVLSTGVATAMGVLGAHRREDTEGVLWGFGDDGAPIFWDGFGERLDEPNHGVVLGMTGTGKTFGVHLLLLREALLRGTQVVELEPMGHGRLLAQALGKRASHNRLSFDAMTVNPLDVVYDTPQDQYAHVMTQVGLLLSRPLDNFEQAAVEAACRDIYAGLSSDDPPALHPRLENLVLALRSTVPVRGDGGNGVGRRLGDELAGLYVDGSLGAVFNAPTNLDFRLEKDVVVFDFNRIPPRFQSLLYGLVLAALQRECLRRRRERRRIVFVDEFKRMSEEPMLAGAVAMMFKTFRTAGVGVWVAEQNLFTLVGLKGQGDLVGGGNLDVVSGRYVMENARFFIILAQQPEGVQAVQTSFSQVTETHAQLLHSALLMEEKGHGIVVFPDGVYTLRIVPTPVELALLSGS
jgi:hypothetical protein